MSPRHLYRWTAGLVVLAAAVVGVGQMWPQGLAFLLDVGSQIATSTGNRTKSGAGLERQQRQDFIARTQPDRGTVLRAAGAPVEFTLPPGIEAVRLLTNANLADVTTARSARRIDEFLRWPYTIEVEAFDSKGATLFKRTHVYRPDLSEIRMPDGTPGTGSLYPTEPDLIPLPSELLRLDFPGGQAPSRLRVALVAADPAIKDVLLRVHVPALASQRDKQLAWSRLSADQKQRLAAGNVFPPQLLNEQERTALMNFRWTPLGPILPSASRDIHVLTEADLGAAVNPTKVAGVPAGGGRVAAMQLPERGGKVLLRLEAINELMEPAGSNAGGFPATVNLRWTGPSPFERRDWSLPWHGGVFEHSLDLGGGWLEVEPSRDAAVRTWIVGQEKTQEITPPPAYMRMWVAQGDTQVDYAVDHAATLNTPLRVVLRRLRSPGQAFPDDLVHVVLLDEAGQVLRRLPIRFAAESSRYDRVWPEQGGTEVSDPFESFFRLPLTAKRVRIESASPVLVEAFTRPGDLARKIVTPEDTVDPAAAESRIPAWFPLQPLAHEALIANAASRLLVVQARPPEDQPELTAGRYAWEEFNPRSGGAARVFFAPREPGVPDRDESLASTFRPLPRGREQFFPQPGHRLVDARLVWTSKRDGNFNYQVTVDGLTWAEGLVSGRTGEINLPAFPAGWHRVSVKADPALRWFTSHTRTGAAWVRRSAQRFETPLQFEIERTGDEEEFVSVRLFRPAGVTGRMRVRVRVDAPAGRESIGPFPGWLFTDRIHDVRPSGELALPVAETGSAATDAGQPFFIPLPKGAQRGRYRITVNPEGGNGWISMSRITPGLIAQRQIIMENLNHVE